MRKIICCALALLLMMGAAVVPAAAAETKTGFYDFQDVDDVKITAKDATGLVTDGSDRMEVVYSKATSGNLYNVYLVEGNSLDVLESDSTKVYYIDQAASTGTSITVNVIPKLPTSDKDMTLFIIGDDETTNVSVSMKYGAGGSAASISGTAVSWNNKADAEFMLYDSSAADATIREEWLELEGEHTSTALYTGKGGSVTVIPSDKGETKYGQSFTFDGVPEGTYKLAIFKPGKYVPKVVEIKIDGGNPDLGEFALWLYGDVNGDSKVNGTDATQIQRYYANKKSVLTLDTDTDEVASDKKLAADVTVKAKDAKINGTDATQIQRYYANKGSVFDMFK